MENLNFNKVIDEIFLPLIEEHSEDMNKILNEDPILKLKVEEKLKRILEKRELNKLKNI